jgi:hypothetical protein
MGVTVEIATAEKNARQQIRAAGHETQAGPLYRVSGNELKSGR